MTTSVYINGKIVADRLARISPFDRGLMHGYGVFETLRAYRGLPYRLDAHLRRMASSARWLNIRIPLPPAALERDIIRLLKANRLKDAIVRITLTGGKEGACRPTVLVTTLPLPVFPNRLYSEGARLLVADWPRNTLSPLQGHKTLNYLENILARERAKSMGAIDTLFLDERRRVLEGSATNIFMVRHGTVLTPPLNRGILAGIARHDVLDICSRERIPVAERPITLTQLGRADEVFVTNSLIEVMPVRQIGTRRAGRTSHPIATRILERYRRDVRNFLIDSGDVR